MKKMQYDSKNKQEMVIQKILKTRLVMMIQEELSSNLNTVESQTD